jgi:Fic/DOC family
MTVPVLPPVAAKRLAAHEQAHLELARRWEKVGDAAAVLALLQRRWLLESHANTPRSDSGDPKAVPLFPRPRSFLTEDEARRIGACDVALGHTHLRGGLWWSGRVSQPIDPSTPLVLHAMLKAPLDGGPESGAGLLRLIAAQASNGLDRFEFPLPDQLSGLLEAAVDLANRAPMPGIVRASWMVFSVLSIRPFADANTRVAHQMFQLLAACDVPLGIDLGVVEQFSIRRRDYSAQIRVGWRGNRYDVNDLDALPFIQFAVDCSTAGAQLSIVRLEAIATEHANRVDAGWDPRHALVAIAVELRGITTVDELSPLNLPPDELIDIVNQLVERRTLQWVPVPASHRRNGVPPSFGLAAAA